MPKMKTRRGAAKRFKVTGNGSLRRHKAMCRHILTKKTRARKRGLRAQTNVSDADWYRVRRMLAIG